MVASGLDASAVDPIARMLLHSERYRAMTRLMRDAAGRHCGGRLMVAHEGGYSGAYTPYAAARSSNRSRTSARKSKVEDPVLVLAVAQHPSPGFAAFQCQLIDEWAEASGF